MWLLDLTDELVLVSHPGEPKEIPHRGTLHWHPPEMPAALAIDLRAVFADLA